MKKVIVVFLLLALVLFSSGCATATNIGDITANPSPYQGKEVTIEGIVSNNFWLALLTKGAYKLTDDTGSIWVVCSHTPPEKNSEVKVKGTVEKAVSIGERSLGTVVVEISRY
mgnify:CR=1 FL=1